MALFISAFFWAYALAQVPAGWLGDRFGSRGVLALYIVSWSFFTAMIGLFLLQYVWLRVAVHRSMRAKALQAA
jgi:MFS family permease